MTEKEKNEQAFKLIDMTGWALKRLYGGTLPAEWKERIKQVCDMSTVGGVIEPEKYKRNVEIATKALGHKIAAKRWKQEGLEHISYNQYVEALMEEYRFQDKKTMLEIIKKHRLEAASELKKALKIFAGASVQFSIDNGEPIDPELAELWRAIELQRADVDRIAEWIEKGESLHLFETEREFQEKFVDTFVS